MHLGKEHAHKGTCTNCGHEFNLASAVLDRERDRKPRVGDATVCIRCGHVMVFGIGLALRDPTGAEIVRLAGDPRLIAAQRARASGTRKRASHGT